MAGVWTVEASDQMDGMFEILRNATKIFKYSRNPVRRANPPLKILGGLLKQSAWQLSKSAGHAHKNITSVSGAPSVDPHTLMQTKTKDQRHRPGIAAHIVSKSSEESGLALVKKMTKKDVSYVEFF